MIKQFICTMALFAMTANIKAQSFVKGGQFQDLILPMEGSIAATVSDWGTTAGKASEGCWKGVLGRWKDNGVEDTKRSYWGGNIMRDKEGIYHLYLAGWPEKTPRGHMAWSSKSRVYHTTSSNINGPYTFIEDIGEGHNPETYLTADSTYVIYIIGGRYTSRSLNGPWKHSTFDFDLRNRKLVAGENRKSSLSNLSFARREDNSFLMVDRGGSIWVSRDGLNDAWHQITDHSVYKGNRRYYEDPVLWHDSVQYHMIVNDWNARKAYYMRSLDGRKWITEAGVAYCADDKQFKNIFSVHKDGTEEWWYKYERPRIYQDNEGRAAYINFAVIDCVKKADKGSDNHSSKNIVLPLQKPLLTEMIKAEGNTYIIKIKAEKDFKPKRDLNIKTLRFGCHSYVNYGKGLKVKKVISQDNDLIVTFIGKGEESGITPDEWAPKLLGEKKDGSIAFSYVRMPHINARPALLTSLCVNLEAPSITIQNYGQSTSQPSTVRVYATDQKTIIAEGYVPSIKAYDKSNIPLVLSNNSIPQNTDLLTIRFFNSDNKVLITERIPYSASSHNLPTMGWSSWNTYHVNISDSLITKQADAMVKLGLKKAGYSYINIDDGYFGGRDSKTGRLLIHPTRFQNGLKNVVNHIHGLGLKAGIYSDAGANTCGSWYDKDTIAIGVGLYGHEQHDCDMFFNELGFDFIKIDFCGGSSTRNAMHLALDPKKQYTEIRKAIDRTGRKDVRVNVCRWDYPGTWVSQVADSWRISHDIRDNWSSVKDIIQQNLYLSAYVSPGHYNDMDMLEVGRRLKPEEDRTHFAIWCMMSSPLLIGCDLTKLRPETLRLLTNKDLIALNQDSLGLQAYVAQKTNNCYILVKDIEKLHGNKRAFAIYNPTDKVQTITIDMTILNLGGEIRLRDLLEQKDLGIMPHGERWNGIIPPHATRIFLAECSQRLQRNIYEAETAYLSSYQELYNPIAIGTAYYTTDPKCSGEMKVSNLGLRPDNDLQWRDVYCKEQGNYHVTIRTVNFNSKQALYISANNGNAKLIKAKDVDANGNIALSLNLKKGQNTVRLYNDNAAMPDIDYMELHMQQ